MREIELLCLASSFKPGGRCVAGIDLLTDKWIRPVASRASGTIPESVYHLDDAGRATRPLDVVRIQLDARRPEPEQPENWEIADDIWELVDESTLGDAEEVIEGVVSAQPRLFGSSGARLRVDDIPPRGVSASLAVVKARSPTFYVRRRPTGSRQLRTVFSLGREQYDLPVTDLEPWADALRQADERVTRDGEWYFTVSLTQRLNDVCYKLVAAGFEIIP